MTIEDAIRLVRCGKHIVILYNADHRRGEDDKAKRNEYRKKLVSGSEPIQELLFYKEFVFNHTGMIIIKKYFAPYVTLSDYNNKETPEFDRNGAVVDLVKMKLEQAGVLDKKRFAELKGLVPVPSFQNNLQQDFTLLLCIYILQWFCSLIDIAHNSEK